MVLLVVDVPKEFRVSPPLLEAIALVMSAVAAHDGAPHPHPHPYAAPHGGGPWQHNMVMRILGSMAAAANARAAPIEGDAAFWAALAQTAMADTRHIGASQASETSRAFHALDQAWAALPKQSALCPTPPTSASSASAAPHMARRLLATIATVVAVRATPSGQLPTSAAQVWGMRGATLCPDLPQLMGSG